METTAPAAPETPAVAPPAAAPTPPPAAPEAKPPAGDEKAKVDAARYATLAKKEAELVKVQQAVKARQAEFAKYEKELADYRALQEAKAKDPLAVLEKLGLSYDEIVKRKLEASAGDDPGALALKRLEALEKEREEEKKQAAQAAQRERQERSERAYQAKQNEVEEYLKANADTYELTNLYGARDHVLTTIVRHLQETTKVDEAGNVLEPGKILSVKEAADIVEAKLEENLKKATSAKKFAAFVKPAEPAKKPGAKTEPAPTLSADLGPTSTATAQDSEEGPLDTDERLRWVLKKYQSK